MTPKLSYQLNRELLQGRLLEVEKSITRLQELKVEFDSKEKFLSNHDNYGLVEHHLRRSIEGLLSCGSHILSRIPGAKFDEYAAISSQLAQVGILPPEFKESAVKIAKYRNRLVHFYHEVNQEELYVILQDYLTDLEKFHHHLLEYTRSHSSK